MTCNNCGFDISAGEKFCPQCGASTTNNYQAEQAQPMNDNYQPVNDNYQAPVNDNYQAEQTQPINDNYQPVNDNYQPEQTQPQYAPQSEQKSKLVAALLAIFLGGYGVHNFYLGYTKKAIIQVSVSGGCLLLTLISCGVLSPVLVGNLGISIWAFVEFIQILTGSIAVDGKGVPLKD